MHENVNSRYLETPWRANNTEIENMSLKPLDCGRRITDSLIGQNVTILNHEHNLPKGHKLILGDKATVTL